MGPVAGVSPPRGAHGRPCRLVAQVATRRVRVLCRAAECSSRAPKQPASPVHTGLNHALLRCLQPRLPSGCGRAARGAPLLLPCPAPRCAVALRVSTHKLTPAFQPPVPTCPKQVWVLADVERLRQAGAEGGALPHSFHYQSGALGSGLLLLSRFPIAEVGACQGQGWFLCVRPVMVQRQCYGCKFLRSLAAAIYQGLRFQSCCRPAAPTWPAPFRWHSTLTLPVATQPPCCKATTTLAKVGWKQDILQCMWLRQSCTVLMLPCCPHAWQAWAGRRCRRPLARSACSSPTCPPTVSVRQQGLCGCTGRHRSSVGCCAAEAACPV